jgi:hypothetical protein
VREAVPGCRLLAGMTSVAGGVAPAARLLAAKGDAVSAGGVRLGRVVVGEEEVEDIMAARGSLFQG